MLVCVITDFDCMNGCAMDVCASVYVFVLEPCKHSKRFEYLCTFQKGNNLDITISVRGRLLLLLFLWLQRP